MILSCFRCSGSSTPGALHQNKLYGAGRRVHNVTEKLIANKVVYRCTVCETERTPGRE